MRWYYAPCSWCGKVQKHRPTHLACTKCGGHPGRWVTLRRKRWLKVLMRGTVGRLYGINMLHGPLAKPPGSRRAPRCVSTVV